MTTRENKLNLQPNVLEEAELQELFSTVFSDMAHYVSKTYGPFGGNSGYINAGKILTTKDGWNVEQGIAYSKSVLPNIVRNFILEVSRSINVHAGDGTTTGVIAANEINRLITEYKKTYKVHSKFLSSAIKYCVDLICNKLDSMSTKVTEDNMDDIIYRIAEVSLDWDKEYAGYIRDIYHNTHNSIIRVQNSGCAHSYIEYLDGYDLSARLLSEFKHDNVSDSKRYTTYNPIILVFTYTVTMDMFKPLMAAAIHFSTNTKRELVIMAPQFDKSFKDSYNAICIRMIKDKGEIPPLVMAKYYAEYAIEREMLNDFCFLTGANLISKDYDEAGDLIKEFGKLENIVSPNRESYPIGEEGDVLYKAELDRRSAELAEAILKFDTNINKYTGTCEKMVIDNKMLLVSGFGGNESDDAIEGRKNVIRAELDSLVKDMDAKSMFTDEVKLKEARLGKLQLKMGVINVGGFGEANLKATRDALDDAINACRNAYRDGVVIGGGLPIPLAINSIIDDLADVYWDVEQDSGISESLIRDILEIIKKGFINTWKIMLDNKYEGKSPAFNYYPPLNGEVYEVKSLDDLIELCIELKLPWNLISETFDETIIHPLTVEQEVIKGCLHLILTTITTNQLLYNGYEDNDDDVVCMKEVTSKSISNEG